MSDSEEELAEPWSIASDEVDVLLQDCDERLEEVKKQKSLLLLQTKHLQNQLQTADPMLQKQKWQQILAVRKCNQQISSIQSEKYNLLCAAAPKTENVDVLDKDIVEKIKRCDDQLIELEAQKQTMEQQYETLTEQIKTVEHERNYFRAVQQSDDWKHALTTLSLK